MKEHKHRTESLRLAEEHGGAMAGTVFAILLSQKTLQRVHPFYSPLLFLYMFGAVVFPRSSRLDQIGTLRHSQSLDSARDH